MKKLILYFILILSTYADTIEFFHENDIFITDEYYTSGIELKYRKENTGALDRFSNFYLGEKFYTPSNILIENPKDYDRPYAAWLYLGYEREKNEDKRETKEGFQLGITGKHALGGFLQSSLHSVIGEEYPRGWDTEIEEMLGLQYNYSLKREEYYRKNGENYLSRKTHYEVTLGNIFTNLSYGKLFLIGNKTPLDNNQKEFVYSFYYEPQVQLTLYDATLKGSLFNNKSLVTKDFNPLLIKNSIGSEVEYKKIVLNYSMHFYSTDIKDLPWKLSSHIYIKFFIKYKI